MQEAFARPRLVYVPGLDGLRALAVAAVLLYHHHAGLLPGGFLGVELFFVLSGYLITALLGFEWQATGRIDLLAFWLRRARRLLPAVLVLVCVALAISVLFLLEELAQLRGDALAALFYVANWRLVLDERPYFESFGRPSLLLHLWSLSIEEQFYLVWPVILAFGLRRVGLRLMFGIALLGVFASTALMYWLYDPGGDVSRVYYGTDTRAAGLLIGSALALVWPPRLVRAQQYVQKVEPWRDLVGVAALGALAWVFATTHEFQSWLYQGGFLVVGLLSATAIFAVARPGAWLCQTALGIAPLRWLGERSYSIYLWHWPVFALTRPGLDVPLDGWPLFGVRFGITLALAELSYRWVEQPVREGAIEQAWSALWSARGTRKTGLALRWFAAIGGAAALTIWIGVEAASAPPTRPPDYLEGIEVLATDAPAAANPPATLGPVDPVAVLSLPTVPRPAAPTAPPPLAVTPIAGAPAPPPPLQNTREAVVPPPAASGPVHTRDPRQSPGPSAAPSALNGPVLAVGDSIFLGAAQTLGEAIPGLEVDAAVSRQVAALIDGLRARREIGQLPAVVVVHVGNNGYVSPERADELMRVLEEVPRVVVVNTAVPRSWADPNNAAVAAAAALRPNVALVDWRAASAGRYELFWDDGVHLRPEGARLLAELIANAAIR